MRAFIRWRIGPQTRTSHVARMRPLVAILLITAVLPLQSARAAGARDGAWPAVAQMQKLGVVDPRALATRAAIAPGDQPQPGRTLPFLTRTLKPGVAAGAGAPQAPGAALALDPNLAIDADLARTGFPANFKGLGAPDNEAVFGSDWEPPDHALCAGPSSVLQLVNEVVAVYSKSGARLAGPISTGAFFHEVTNDNPGDVRCFYDPEAGAFFASAWGYNSATGEAHIDLAVNPTSDPTTPWTTYSIDTTHASALCPCTPDYTMLGVDAHGVYLTDNEFSYTITPTGPQFTTFNGTEAYVTSKRALLSGTPGPVFFAPSSTFPSDFTVQPATGYDPATGKDPAVEYFVESLDVNGTFAQGLKVFAVTGDASLDSGTAPSLPATTTIASESYAFPPNATQKDFFGQLASDDDRVLQVLNAAGTLWATLNTGVVPSGDAAVRTGAAWFKIVPKIDWDATPSVSATIDAQGYVALAHQYLLYPAIAVGSNGRAAMILSRASSRFYPGVVLAAGPLFDTLRSVVHGGAPSIGFSCLIDGLAAGCRWGDYSAASPDPGTNKVWLGTEYVPGLVDSALSIANWGTRIVEVTP